MEWKTDLNVEFDKQVLSAKTTIMEVAEKAAATEGRLDKAVAAAEEATKQARNMMEEMQQQMTDNRKGRGGKGTGEQFPCPFGCGKTFSRNGLKRHKEKCESIIDGNQDEESPINLQDYRFAFANR